VGKAWAGRCLRPRDGPLRLDKSEFSVLGQVEEPEKAKGADRRVCACFHSIYIGYQFEGGKSAKFREFIFPMRAISYGENVEFGGLTRFLSGREKAGASALWRLCFLRDGGESSGRFLFVFLGRDGIGDTIVSLHVVYASVVMR
jgi:hypothetical protein